MTEDPSERAQRIVSLLGSALVTWAQVEDAWRALFPFILFADLTVSGDGVFETMTVQDDIRHLRAHTMWDGLNSSEAQLSLIRNVARVTLTNSEQLELLLQLAHKTKVARGKRNALAHGGFQRGTMITVDGLGGPTVEQNAIWLTEHAHRLLRGKDPLTAIPAFTLEFHQLFEEITSLQLWISLGLRPPQKP